MAHCAQRGLNREIPTSSFRSFDAHADLHTVRVFHQGRLVAEHPRIWATGTTITDPAHVSAAAVLRQVFRGQKRERHGKVVRVVAKLVNRRMVVRPLKTYAA